MSVHHEIIAAGGTVQDQGQSWVISYWSIPGGADYNNAQPRQAFFSDKETADRIAERFSNPPEMAIAMSRETYEAAKLQTFRGKKVLFK